MNTDAHGFLEPLRRRMPDPPLARRAVPLAGRRGSCVGLALRREGAQVAISARRPGRGAARRARHRCRRRYRGRRHRDCGDLLDQRHARSAVATQRESRPSPGRCSTAGSCTPHPRHRNPSIMRRAAAAAGPPRRSRPGDARRAGRASVRSNSRTGAAATRRPVPGRRGADARRRQYLCDAQAVASDGANER